MVRSGKMARSGEMARSGKMVTRISRSGNEMGPTSRLGTMAHEARETRAHVALTHASYELLGIHMKFNEFRSLTNSYDIT